MPSWIIKAAVQGTLSQLPEPQRWNRLLQKHVTRSLELKDDYFLEKFGQSRRHVEHWRRHRGGNRDEEECALELGTGWFPIIPIGLTLQGIHSVYSVDLQSLLAKESVEATLQMYAKHLHQGRLRVTVPDASERVAQALSWIHELPLPALLGRLGITPLVGDASALKLEAHSVDLICSNNTLEHIPSEVIAAILKEFHRILKPGGLMSHHIDMADHYANFDSSISVYNFLKYRPNVWRYFNNQLQYQNRLRLPDFRELHERAGFEILAEDNKRADPAELTALTLADEFQSYRLEDLLVFDTWITSRPTEFLGTR